jgi:serpin B
MQMIEIFACPEHGEEFLEGVIPFRQTSFARFRIETQADLSAPLKALGMSQVFDPARATLDGISDRKPLYLMGVVQRDFVEVNEKGTEAAAVTMLMEGAAPNLESPPPPFEMIVNRPFVFAICDDFSGVVVFLGAVVDPLAG